MRDKSKPKWVALDGIDAVGKTTQMSRVANLLTEEGLEVIQMPEFSDSDLGNMIREIIERRRFFALNKERNTPIANMLLLLADLVFKMENSVKGEKVHRLYLSDRGILSLLAYEAVKTQTLTRNSLDGIFSQMDGIVELATRELPVPDLHIIYSASIDKVNERVLARGESTLTASQRDFLNDIQGLLTGSHPRYPSVIIDTTEATEASITAATIEVIRNSIFPRR